MLTAAETTNLDQCQFKRALEIKQIERGVLSASANSARFATFPQSRIRATRFSSAPIGGSKTRPDFKDRDAFSAPARILSFEHSEQPRQSSWAQRHVIFAQRIA